MSNINEPKPVRLLPGIIILVLQWLARFIIPEFAPDIAMYSFMIGVFGGALAILVWWIFFSRVPHLERWGALLLIIIAVLVTPFFLEKSIATGAMGLMFYIYVIPGLCLALVAWAIVSRYLSVGIRRLALIAAIVLASGCWTLLKTGGFGGNFDQDFSWRWAETPEQRLLDETTDEPMAAITAAQDEMAEIKWPGYLGPDRDGIIHDIRINTDWTASPPVELWRRPIGPGWSSFAVQGDLFYTQEQRGDEEVISCYDLNSGQPVWRHGDTTRFWESNAGAGPRGTPTLNNGRVYALGATGKLNALDALTGAVVWSHDAATDTEANLPTWGFSSSPLVLDNEVVVAVSGALIAYDIVSGKPLWSRPPGDESYSSPQLVTIDSVRQVLILNSVGLTSINPADGTQLWQHQWKGYPIVQPVLTSDGDILISVEAQSGLRRISVRPGSSGWTVEEKWTSRGLKPYYSHFVVHDGHAFGFDGSILSCVDVTEGKRKWKGGRYGAGQLFLLADQDLLFVLGEKGDLALVKAASDKFTEVARFPALEGKTWNHPVLIGDLLLVRNAQEMAAFRLKLIGS